MKAPPFAYIRPADLAEALDILERHGEEAQILAGGQSLIPAMNFRLNAPSVLVDINRIEALSGIERRADCIRIGALVRHAELEASDIVRQALPLLAEAIHHVAHPAVRSRGTFGGSLALADPAAELPACAVTLEATIVLAGPEGRRAVPAADFFRGLYDTDRRPGEILVETLFPLREEEGERSLFLELSRRHGDFAMAGMAGQAAMRNGRIARLRLVPFGCVAYPHAASAAGAAAVGEVPGPALAARVAAALAAEIEPFGDIHGDAAMKRHLAQLLARRAIERLAS